jgi:hypothetical protein
VLGQVILFAEDDTQAAACGVACDPGAIDAAAHHEYVTIDALRFAHVLFLPVPGPSVVLCGLSVFGHINLAGRRRARL